MNESYKIWKLTWSHSFLMAPRLPKLAVFQSCFSFSLLPPWINTAKNKISSGRHNNFYSMKGSMHRLTMFETDNSNFSLDWQERYSWKWNKKTWALKNSTVHCVKCRNFTKLHGVQILWKGAVSVEFRAIRLSTKFSHHEIRRNYGILHSG